MALGNSDLPLPLAAQGAEEQSGFDMMEMTMLIIPGPFCFLSLSHVRLWLLFPEGSMSSLHLASPLCSS